MIKKDIFNGDVKKQLLARKEDRVYKFLMGDGNLRGAMITGLTLVNEMKANHGLDPFATLALGQGFLAGGLLSSTLKEGDRIAISVDCGGAIKGLTVEATYHGEVRGFIKNRNFIQDSEPESLDLSKYYGNGVMTLTRYTKNQKQPYTGTSEMRYGSMALDLANYFYSSEQTPTVFNLSINFNEEGEVNGAGGVFIQAMPGAEPALINSLADIAKGLPSIGKELSEGVKAEEYIKNHFKDLNPDVLDNKRVEFFCACNKKSVTKMIEMLPEEDLKDLKENGPFPLSINCNNCNTSYEFSKDELKEIHTLKAN